MNLPLRTLAVLLVIFSFLPQHSYALTPVPAGLSASQNAALTRRYSKLTQLKAALNSRIDQFEAKCARVVEGSKPEKECAREQAKIKIAKGRYKADVDAYEHELVVAIFLSKPVPNLTGDPVAVRLNNLRLREVEGRVRRLQMAIDILSSSNPEWDKEWDRVYQDMRRDSDQLSWVALDLLTLDLAELNKLAKEADFAKAGSVLEHELWKKIPAQQEKFQRLLTTARGDEAAILQKCIESIDGLEKAHEAKRLADVFGRLRDVLFLMKELHEKKPLKVAEKGKEEAAYEQSLLFGQLAMVFLKGVGEKAVVGGTFVARGLEAELLFSMLLQEEKQHRVLSNASYDRHQKKLELMKQLEELEGEKGRLEYARDRSQPKAD